MTPQPPPPMVLHPRTEPLRELVRAYKEAPIFAKPAYAVEVLDRLLTLLADECHGRDRLELRVRALERPQTQLPLKPSEGPPRGKGKK